MGYIKRLLSLSLIFLMLTNLILPYKIFAGAPEEPPDLEETEWKKNERLKDKTITPKTPKRPVNAGHPYVNVLVNLALLTPWADDIVEDTMQLAEDLDYYLYYKIEEMKPYLKDGIIYTSNEFKEFFERTLREFGNEHYDTIIDPTYYEYANLFEGYEPRNNAVLRGSIEYGIVKLGSRNMPYYFIGTIDIIYGPYKNYNYRGYSTIRGFRVDGKDEEGYPYEIPIGVYQPWFSGDTISEVMDEFRDYMNSDTTKNSAEEFFNNYRKTQLYNIPNVKFVSTPTSFNVGGRNFNIQPEQQRIVTIDDVPHTQYDVPNPYFNPDKDIDPVTNPEHIPYYVPISVPAAEPIPEPIPEIVPVTIPEPSPDPNPDPNPEPSPDPNPNPNPNPNPEPSPEPSPEPTPEPSPTPVPIPNAPEPEFGEGKGCRELDLDLKSIDLFTTKFPFSIPWDIYRALEAFFGKMGSEEPRFVLTFISEDTVLELPEIIKEWIPLVRSLILLIFDVSIIYALYRWFGGAS